MQQQLQSQIRKNKNLLQSNFTLMQENQLFANALALLRTCLHADSRGEDGDHGQDQEDREDRVDDTVQADQAEELVREVLGRVRELSHPTFQSPPPPLPPPHPKPCQCQKWRQMYRNQSQQSLRLSKKIVELQQRISYNESKHDEQRKQMENILKDYLLLFKRVNSVEFMQGEAVRKAKEKEIPREGVKEAVKQNRGDSSKNKQKQKRSTSRSKTNPLRTPTNPQKKPQKQAPQQQKPNQSLSTKVIEQLQQFPNFLHYLQGLRQDIDNMQMENKLLREEISDAETLIRIYRDKERERKGFVKFL